MIRGPDLDGLMAYMGGLMLNEIDSSITITNCNHAVKIICTDLIVFLKIRISECVAIFQCVMYVLSYLTVKDNLNAMLTAHFKDVSFLKKVDRQV